MAEYLLETTDDYRAQAHRLSQYGQEHNLGQVLNAAGSIHFLADRVDYLTDLMASLDTWIEDHAYNADGSKV